ncbi:twin-arginine translocase subunit TatC [Verrucomicrobiota bacterium]
MTEKLGAGPTTGDRKKEDPNKTLPDEGEGFCTKSFLGHLEDLRATIIWCAVLFVVGIVVAIPLARTIITLLKVPFFNAIQSLQLDIDPDTLLRGIRLTDAFSIGMRVVFWSGLLFSLPFIVIIVGAFVFPGLKRKERGAVLRAGGLGVLLFAGGVSMGYIMVLPAAIKIMLKFYKILGISYSWFEFRDYIAFVIRLLMAFGLAFQLPVIILVLGTLGIISSRQLRDKRPYVIITLLIAAMILTPPDIITQIMMALPLVVLYEICVWLIWLKERKRPTS